jgi:hypothetical protein
LEAVASPSSLETTLNFMGLLAGLLVRKQVQVYPA